VIAIIKIASRNSEIIEKNMYPGTIVRPAFRHYTKKVRGVFQDVTAKIVSNLQKQGFDVADIKWNPSGRFGSEPAGRKVGFIEPQF